MKKFFTPNLIFVSSLVLGAAMMRLLPHWPNFTPVAAIALFGGAMISRKQFAFLLPLLAMFVSDLFLGFHSYLLAVYGSFVLTVLLGFLLRRSQKAQFVGAASVASSLLFFLITNFAVWISNPYFSQDINGLIQCYTVAIPFMYNGVIGDLFFSALLFGSFALVSQRFPALQPLPAKK